MSIVAFAASNSSQSINASLVRHAAAQLAPMLPDSTGIELLDINDFEMPLYSADREAADGIPPQAHAFYQRLGAADGLMISFAEHNGHYTAAYKNLFDWASRIDGKVYQGKPMLIMSASPGPGGAGSVLAAAEASAPFFGAQIAAKLSVGRFHEVFDLEAGQLRDADLSAALTAGLQALSAALPRAVAA